MRNNKKAQPSSRFPASRHLSSNPTGIEFPISPIWIQNNQFREVRRRAASKLLRSKELDVYVFNNPKINSLEI
jgi:hypothetical protein